MRTAIVAFVLACSVGFVTHAAEPTRKGAGPQSWIGDLSPISDADWSYERARHLLERAGFGGTPEEIQRLADMKPAQAVDYLVEYQKLDSSSLPPFEESGIYYRGYPAVEDTVPAAIGSAYRRGEWSGLKVDPPGQPLRLQRIVFESYYVSAADGGETRRLAHWWAERMLNSPRPLEEKLALFWHGHFATSNSKALRYDLMKQHYEMLRDRASGSFKDLLTAVSKDPQMLVWLDNRHNTKEHPNENYAREVLELFTMGVGNYTEKDIREIARAFTGWTLDAEGLRGDAKGKSFSEAAQFVNRPDIHDETEKSFFHQTGKFDGDDAIRIILEQPATARFVSGRLYRFFARADAPEALRQQLADRLREAKFELKPFLKTIFLSKDFYSPASFAAQIKAPVQLVISTYRKLGFKQIPGTPDFRATTAGLGQELFFPPNVAGWEGGRTWINPATMFARGNFAEQLLSSRAAVGAAGPGRNPFAPRHIEGETDEQFKQRMDASIAGANQRYLARQRSAEAQPAAGSGPAAPSMTGEASTTGGEPQMGAGSNQPEQPSMGGAASMSSDATVAAQSISMQPGMQADGEAKPLTSESTSRDARYRSEAYNLGVAFTAGYAMAAARVKPIPRPAAAIDLLAMARAAKAGTPTAAVDYFVSRFLLVPLEKPARKAMIRWTRERAGADTLDLDNPATEQLLRKLVILILSTPEYQLG